MLLRNLSGENVGLTPGVTARRAFMANRNSNHFDRRLDEILRRAAAVFCARGYHQASIRDIARAARASLAGLYYYFSSKEELLFLIQRHTFETILAAARASLERLDGPVERLHAFIRLHLEFSLEHPNEMKVLTHEEGSLEEDWRHEVHALKKAYYQLCYDQVEAYKQAHKLKGLNTRLAVLSLFGTMNWIYTWYRPKVDPDARTCARQMAEIFLRGISGSWARRADRAEDTRLAGSGNGSRRAGRRRVRGAGVKPSPAGQTDGRRADRVGL